MTRIWLYKSRFLVLWASAILFFIAGHRFFNAVVFTVVTAALILTGAIAAVHGLYRASRERAYRPLAIPLTVILLIAILLSPLAHLVGIYTRALIEVPGYQSAMKESGPGGFPECLDKTVCDQDGQWIIFSWGGLLNRWSGIVYDPGKTIDGASHRDRSAFGGDLNYVRHLWGAWYYCGFN